LRGGIVQAGARQLKVRIPYLFLLPRFFERNAANAAVALCDFQGASAVFLGAHVSGYPPAKSERLAVVGQCYAAELLTPGAAILDGEVIKGHGA